MSFSIITLLAFTRGLLKQAQRVSNPRHGLKRLDPKLTREAHLMETINNTPCGIRVAGMGGNEVGRANKTKLVHGRTSQLSSTCLEQIPRTWSGQLVRLPEDACYFSIRGRPCLFILFWTAVRSSKHF